MLKKWKVVIERDDDGFVKSISLPEDFTEVSDEELSFLDEESELKHADISKKSWKVVIERDDDGFVKSISLPEDFTEVSDEELSFLDEGNSELKHYGVLGQKWGIRKDDGAKASVVLKRLSQARNRRTIPDDELAAAVKRLELEKKFKELAAEDNAPGVVAIRGQLSRFMGTALGAAAGVAGAAIVKQILKSKGIVV